MGSIISRCAQHPALHTHMQMPGNSMCVCVRACVYVAVTNGKEREVGEKDCMQYTINSLLSRGILNMGCLCGL